MVEPAELNSPLPPQHHAQTPAIRVGQKKMDNVISLLGHLLLGIVLLLALASYVFLLPPKHPQGIPAIPFWVTLIPLFKDVDQAEIYGRYIEEPIRTHGAVKLFFAARWNVVVHRPRYLAEIFKQGGVYEKSGNQKKIPYSVLAEFLGDNIISSHGWTWKRYRDVIKPGLQKRFETGHLARNAEKLCDLISKAGQEAAGKGHGIPVQELLQRYTIANVGQVILQTDFGVSAIIPYKRIKIRSFQFTLTCDQRRWTVQTLPYTCCKPL